jgi:hypothetical protein
MKSERNLDDLLSSIETVPTERQFTELIRFSIPQQNRLHRVTIVTES